MISKKYDIVSEIDNVSFQYGRAVGRDKEFVTPQKKRVYLFIINPYGASRNVYLHSDLNRNWIYKKVKNDKK